MPAINQKTLKGVGSDARLIVFTRYPEPGRTKTRLIPCLGEKGAAEIQRQMTEFILSRISTPDQDRSFSVEIRYEGGDETGMREWLGENYHYLPQPGGDLDRRMGQAFREAFEDGVSTAVIIGTDIPGITPRIISEAFGALGSNDLVLGPAADGGYYLIGLNRASHLRALPEMMTGISWGTGDVLKQTLQITSRLRLKELLLEELQDVDRPEDLNVWEQAYGVPLDADLMHCISVIIPTLNESDNIVATLNRVMTGNNVEVIIVDGGSRDDTIDLAQSFGARVIRCEPSRSRQMNTGARAARGNILLFLHADTSLPDRYDVFVRRTLQMPDVVAGAFELRIDSPRSSLRVMEKVANLRSRYLHKPYGDQAYFLTARLFEELGAFPELPIMEDYALIRRLGKQGRIAIIPEPVFTSARRWLNFGIYKTWIVNQMIVAAYHIGISPQTIARWYKRERGITEK